MIVENHRAKATASLIGIYRSAGIAKRRRRLPKQIPPRPIEREYARELKRFIIIIRELMVPIFHELPGLMESAQRESVRADAGEGRRAQQLMDQVRMRLQDSLKQPQLEGLAKEFAEKTQTYQRVQLLKQTRAAFGVDISSDKNVGSMIEGFISENVSLIKDIPTKLVNDLERTIQRGITSGKLQRDIAKDLEKNFEITEKRAKLIARDQVSKFYGQVNVARQKAIGVVRFIWRTVNDERVREEHEAREGNTYTYDDPPDGELPGEPINCRCYPEPVFDDILEEVD